MVSKLARLWPLFIGLYHAEFKLQLPNDDYRQITLGPALAEVAPKHKQCRQVRIDIELTGWRVDRPTHIVLYRNI